jgi:hypothetical protein
LENNNIITLSNGAQFHEGKSAYLFIFLILLLLILAGVIISAIYLALLLILPAILLLSIYILDVRGIQIDLTNQLIRPYKQNIRGKKGEWLPLKTFNKIILIHEFYKTREVSLVEEESYVTTHGHFVVRLIHTTTKKSLMVSQDLKYSVAKKTIHKLSKSLRFEMEDTYHAKLVQSMNMRSWQ